MQFQHLCAIEVIKRQRCTIFKPHSIALYLELLFVCSQRGHIKHSLLQLIHGVTQFHCKRQNLSIELKMFLLVVAGYFDTNFHRFLAATICRNKRLLIHQTIIHGTAIHGAAVIEFRFLGRRCYMHDLSLHLHLHKRRWRWRCRRMSVNRRTLRHWMRNTLWMWLMRWWWRCKHIRHAMRWWGCHRRSKMGRRNHHMRRMCMRWWRIWR
mmetsp:Transcript_26531/g.43418  ORF Transcript_26531/g.43418 Transcript_26531/m.43418 type:complete len:209 (+) Transcript_26531:118-744(+)